jgi:cob(I)alamin adenosyltransferase
VTKIYTKTGDAGQTGLLGGTRVPKSDARVEAYGDVDELSSTLGLARAHLDDPDLDGVLAQAQRDLILVGAELATPPGARGPAAAVERAALERLEQAIDRWELELPRLERFILPAGTRGAAALHVARTVCRRAERHSTAVPGGAPPVALAYLNRLSDLLFVAARVANARAGRADES